MVVYNRSFKIGEKKLMWTLLLILGGALALLAWIHDPKVDEEHATFIS